MLGVLWFTLPAFDWRERRKYRNLGQGTARPNMGCDGSRSNNRRK